MAELNNKSEEPKIIVSIGGDSTDLDKSLNDSKKKIQDLGNTPVSTTSFKNYKTAIKEATNEAQKMEQQFGKSSSQFVEAAKRVAALRDEFSEFSETVNSFNPDNKLQGLVSLAKGATGAISAVASGFTLIGVNSENAQETIAKLQALMNFSQALNSVDDIKNSFKNLGSVLALTTKAQEGATLATRSFGLALKATGIGLLTAALSYCITNFDSLKDSVKELIPGLDKAGDIFNKVKSSVVAVGGAVVDFLITPFKAFNDLINGDFSAAIDQFRNGMNVVANTEKHYNDQRKKQADEVEREMHDTRAKALEEAIKLYKAAGHDTVTLEKEMYQERLKAQKVGTDEYNKAIQEQSIYEAGEYKKRQDKSKQDAEKRLAELKANVDKVAQIRKGNLEKIARDESEANKIINAGLTNARQKELKDAEFEYQKRLVRYKQYGSDSTKLTEAYRITQLSIEKKYDDLINASIKEAGDKNLTVYEQKKQAINAKIDELLKNATDTQKKQLEELRNGQLAGVNREQKLNTVSVDAQVNLTTTTSNTVIDDRTDTPEVRREKLEALYEAENEFLQADFELKLEQLGSNNEQIELLTAEHNAKLTDIERERVEANRVLDDAQYSYKVNTLKKVGDAVGAVGELIGQQTIAGKALAIGSATVNTFLGATEVLRAPSVLPEPFGTIQKVASMVTVIATGLSAVKKIAAVNIKGSSSSGSAPSMSVSDIANATAPSISAASLNQNTQPQDVRVINNQDTAIKVFVTDKDLKESQERNGFYNTLSNF